MNFTRTWSSQVSDALNCTDVILSLIQTQLVDDSSSMKSETRYLWGVLLACLLATSMAQSDDILEDGEDDGKVEVEDDSSENEIKTAQVCT